MSKLYDDAIADARHLRQLAEKAAERRIIEAMTPKIKMIVEQELSGDAEGIEFDDLVDVAGEYADEMRFPAVDIDVADGATINVIGTSDQDENDTDYIPDEDVPDEYVAGDEDIILSQEAARALAQLIREQGQKNDITYRVRSLKHQLVRFNRLMECFNNTAYSSLTREPARNLYTQLRKELISLRNHAILTEGTEKQNGVGSDLKILIKEFQKMSRRHANRLFGLLSERGLDELDVVLDDVDLETLGVEDVEDVDVSGMDVQVTRGGEEEVEEPGEEEEVMDLGELDLILTDDDLGVLGVEDVEDVDVGGLDVEVLMGDEGEDEGAEEEALEDEGDEVFEIDEAALRRTLHRMRRRRIREQEESVAADADPSLAHGGEDLGDPVLDVDEDDLLNALADELGTVDDSVTVAENSRRRRASRSRRPRSTRSPVRRQTSRRIKESRNSRVLKTQVGKYKRAVGALKGQLVEMNLFNAKLLYVNKLMQSRNLSSKQQRAIVEALDNARTLREARLLYKSLTQSLNKRSSLTEGKTARTLGSSSRSTRSATPATSGVEVDRWSVLAGLSDKK